MPFHRDDQTAPIDRALTGTCLPLFAVSAAFPVAAGAVATAPVPRWVGVADLAVASLLVLTAISVHVWWRDRVQDADRLAALRSTQTLLLLIPVLLATFFVIGDRLNRNVFVVGLAWRGWLLAHTLPSLFAAPRTGRASSP
jgi:hypothetical protein